MCCSILKRTLHFYLWKFYKPNGWMKMLKTFRYIVPMCCGILKLTLHLFLWKFHKVKFIIFADSNFCIFKSKWVKKEKGEQYFSFREFFPYLFMEGQSISTNNCPLKYKVGTSAHILAQHKKEHTYMSLAPKFHWVI